jgi:hypothetical protein
LLVSYLSQMESIISKNPFPSLWNRTACGLYLAVAKGILCIITQMRLQRLCFSFRCISLAEERFLFVTDGLELNPEALLVEGLFVIV